MINQPYLKVGIMAEKELSISLLSEYREKNGPLLPVGLYHVEYTAGQISVTHESGMRVSGASPEFIPMAENAVFQVNQVTIGIDFHWEKKEDQQFTGGVQLIPEGENIRLINVVKLEDYLKSVIASEMSSTSSMSLLKAHAVISRSWLIAQVGKREKLKAESRFPNPVVTDDTYIKWYDREDHDTFDVCADDHCQRYHGITKIHSPKALQAVMETSGEVLMFNGEICDARFSKCCGGISESFENAWEPVHHPYLTRIIDSEGDPQGFATGLRDEKSAETWIRNAPPAHCNTSDKQILSQVLPDFDQATSDFYRWKKEYTQEELAGLIRKKSGHDFGDIIRLEPVERGFSGRLVKLRIVGTKKTVVVGKELEIRKWLSESHLYSSAFVVDYPGIHNTIPPKIRLTGAGWGHGVGLCQIGAAVMGEKGYSYRQILEHYFSGSSLHKQY